MRLQNGPSIGSFHDDIILRALRYHFRYFKSFLTFSMPLFLQNRNTLVKIDYANFKLDLTRKFFYCMTASVEYHRMHWMHRIQMG